jgi:hypothetical protein
VKGIAARGKEATVKTVAKRRSLRKENVGKSASKHAAPPNYLRDTIEKLMGMLFNLFTTRLLQIPSAKATKSPIEKLYYALSSAANKDDDWFEGTAKDELNDVTADFYKAIGITGFATSRGVISTRRHTNTLEIEYLLLVPEWNAQFLEAMGSSDEFHLAIYWDTQTWPRYKVISDGLDDEQEGMRRVGGVKVYN